MWESLNSLRVIENLCVRRIGHLMELDEEEIHD